MRSKIIEALRIAREAHEGQQYTRFGETPEPYVMHCIRVALRVPEHFVVAVLHDVFEDTPVQIDDIPRDLLTSEEALALGVLTRRKPFEQYADYIERVATSGSDIAVAVKVADLQENLAQNPRSPEHRKRYRRALDRLIPPTTFTVLPFGGMNAW